MRRVVTCGGPQAARKWTSHRGRRGRKASRSSELVATATETAFASEGRTDRSRSCARTSCRAAMWPQGVQAMKNVLTQGSPDRGASCEHGDYGFGSVLFNTERQEIGRASCRERV